MSEHMHLEKGELNIKIVVSIVVAVVGILMWFYSQVVIPINNMQIDLAQIKVTINANSDKYDALIKDHQEIDKRISAIETRLNIPTKSETQNQKQ